MINLKLNDKTYAIPQEWSDITLQKLIELESIRANYEAEEQAFRVVECLTGINAQTLRSLSIQTANRITQHLSFQNQLPEGVVYNFTVNKVQYEGPENLSEIAFGQFAHLMRVHKQYGEKERPFASIPQIAAMLYFRPGESYAELSDKKLQARAESFKQMSALDGLKIANFFLILSQVFQTDTRKSLRRKLMKAMDLICRGNASSKENTHGGASLPALPEVLMKSARYLRNQLAASLRG